uniref:GRIP domain-containing protein n=1 Tax=Cacopsylla melanoneura TaxID=428564 RepID=A0A8D8V9E3_9HEMI
MSQPREVSGGRSPLHRRSLSLDASSAEVSRIPIPSSSPRTLLRQGSFKMRPDAPRPPTISEWEENKSNTSQQEKTSPGTNTASKLKRYRSLQGIYPSPSSPAPYNGHRHSLTLDYHTRDDDQDSVSSMTSNASSLCEHAHFARNGTTYSARKMKYIVHCSTQPENESEYLTPTQRANKNMRRLRSMLAEAQVEIMDKENEIMRLTKELVELRLNKATSRDMKDEVEDNKHSCDSHHITSTTLEDNASSISTNGAVSPQLGDLPLSLADSGHFEDLPCSNHHLERELDRVRKMHDEMREKYQDKVESLLKKITETNDRFYELKPQYDSAALRVKELEKENADLKKKLQEQEDLHQSMIHLYSKEKAGPLPTSPVVQKNTQGNQTDHVNLPPSPSPTAIASPPLPPPKSIADENAPKILQELEITRRELEEIKDSNYLEENPTLLSAREAVSLWILGSRKKRYDLLKDTKPPNDAEMTLQFLKSAIYYFLTDPVNAQGHLTAILSILRYNDTQKENIMKTQAHAWKYSYY